MASKAETPALRWLSPAALSLAIACSAANPPAPPAPHASSAPSSALDAGSAVPDASDAAVADAPVQTDPAADAGELPPREYATQRFTVKVAPATRAPCDKLDASLDELHFSNACVEQSAEGVRLGVRGDGGAGLTWKQLSRQDQGRTRFIEIEESVPIPRPGEVVLAVAVMVQAVLPLSSVPGKYTLRVNNACVPFEVSRKSPAADAAVRTCIRDQPMDF
ncbi:MAG: hypothetical protein AB7K71_15150 [Polyangiaceae bacterium]